MSISDAAAMKEDMEIYKATIKLPTFEPQMDINGMIAILSGGDIGKLDGTTLSEYAVRLSCYATYLTTEINRQRTTVKWAEANIRNLLAQHSRNMTEYSYAEKMAYFVANNEDGAKFEAIRLKADVKLSMLEALDEKMRFIATSTQNLARERSWARKNYNVSH